MKAKYDENPLYEFYNELKTVVEEYINDTFKEYPPVHSVIRHMLRNNGCKFALEDHSKEVYIMEENYCLCFISGAEGNNINDIFDIVDINGMTYLIIFMDSIYKDIIIDDAEPTDEIAATAKDIMGRSNGFDKIMKLTDVFIRSISNPAVFTSQLSTTAVANNYRLAPYIIASSILELCGPLEENDISGINLESLKDVKNVGIELNLRGIYDI